MKHVFALLLSFMVVGGAAVNAQEMRSEKEQFVVDNLIATLFHELGHAVIDTMLVPVFGQEEDAADVFATILIHEVFEPEAATAIMEAQLDVYRLSIDETQDVPWDVHGSNEQRYFNGICIFYGLEPDNREQFLDNYNLPDERLVSCEEEAEIAYDSWAPILDELQQKRVKNRGIKVKGLKENHFSVEALRQAHDVLVEEKLWPKNVRLEMARCNEANAFYDPEKVTITMCNELVEDLHSYFKAK